MLKRLRGRSTPLEWFIVALVVAFMFYAWSFYAWRHLSDDRAHDQARNLYGQCMESAKRSSDLHEVLTGIVLLAVDGDTTNRRAQVIDEFIDKKLPPRDCSALKP